MTTLLLRRTAPNQELEAISQQGRRLPRGRSRIHRLARARETA